MSSLAAGTIYGVLRGRKNNWPVLTGSEELNIATKTVPQVFKFNLINVLFNNYHHSYKLLLWLFCCAAGWHCCSMEVVFINQRTWDWTWESTWEWYNDTWHALFHYYPMFYFQWEAIFLNWFFGWKLGPIKSSCCTVCVSLVLKRVCSVYKIIMLD